MPTKRSLIIALILSIPYFTQAQPLNSSIDKLLTAYQRKGQFDGSILIAKNKRITYFKQYGLANRQFGVPIKENTLFAIASITKLYTAILILQLQEKGKLNLDSSLYTYAPDLLPKNNRAITVRQLLTHVSGLPNEATSAYESRYSIKDFIYKNIKDTLLSKPGQRYKYSNVNFILLGCIIEQITKKSWIAVLNEEVVKPLNLTHTGVIKTDSVIKNLAYGYHNYAFGDLPAKPLKNDGFVYMENYATAGAIYTTPQELFKLHLALINNLILSASSTKVLFGPQTSIGKIDHTDYYVAFGGYVGNKRLKGHDKPVRAVERTGNINGFNTTYIQLPDSGVTLIIFCNTDAGDLYKIQDEVLALLPTL